MLIVSVASVILFGASANSAEIDSITHVINTDGEVIDTGEERYFETGVWTDAPFTGYNNLPVRISTEAGNSVLWRTPVSQIGHKYELYFWKSVTAEGDTQATVKGTSFTESATIKVDFSKGYADWQRIGVLNLPDTLFSLEVTPGDIGKVLPVCAFKYVLSNDEEYNIDRIFDINSNLMVLMKDCRTALYNHEYMEIPDVAPVIINDRTMLPIRFISENMGLKVEWNSSEKSVAITDKEHTVIFFTENQKYIVDGEEKLTDRPPVILNNRTLVPMRALAEALGKKVLWEDNGVILLGDTVDVMENRKEAFYSSVIKVFPEKFLK